MFNALARVQDDLHMAHILLNIIGVMPGSTHSISALAFCHEQPVVEGAIDVVQDVEHPVERVAVRDDELLREQAEHDWADGVADMIRSSPHANDTSVVPEQIFLLPYTRAPMEFKEALLEGAELCSVREKMRAAGQDFVLQASGAKVFVWPEQYAAVIEAVDRTETQLRASHVIIAESLLPALEASIATISSKRNVRPKKLGVLCVASAAAQATPGSALGAEDMTVDEDSDSEGWQHIFNVERLSLVRVLRNPGSVNQSTTEAHGGVNPRRYGGADPTPVFAAVGEAACTSDVLLMM